MGIPTVFRSDDTGAPTLNGLPGSLNDVLKACLVNGYGSKSALGWELFDEDASGEICVFRAPSGHRQFYRFEHTVASGGAYTSRVAIAGVWEVMTDYNTGSGNWFNRYLGTSSIADASARAWMIIGDEEGFYLWIRCNNVAFAYDSTYIRLHYFGDMIPADPLDTNLAVLGASPVQNYSSSDQNKIFHDYPFSNAYCSLAAYRGLAGTGPLGIRVSGMWGATDGNTFLGTRSGASGSERNLIRAPIYDELDAFKGFMPGLFSSSVSGEETMDPQIVETDYYLLPFRSSTIASCLINFAEDWRA